MKEENHTNTKLLNSIRTLEMVRTLQFRMDNFCRTCNVGNPMPTTKFAIQLTSTAIAIALGRGPWEKSSAVIIHGIEPGPTAKNTTNASVDITDK